MKGILWFFAVLGALAIIALAILVGRQLLQSDGSGKSATMEQAPVLSQQTLDAIQAKAAKIGKHLTWAVVVFAVLMQVGAWIAAVGKLRAIKHEYMEVEERFLQLEAIEVYFDLPLYYGLLGTVLSFIIITIFPDTGLMFAYVSTAMGIVVSVILRIFYLTPYKQELISRGRNIQA